jgi:hypothetical protein
VTDAYRSPTIGGVVGLVLGLVGLAVSLDDDLRSDVLALVVIGLAALAIVVSLIWALAVWLRYRRDERIRSLIAAALAEQRASAPQPGPSLASSPNAAQQRRDREQERLRQLRRAANEIAAELEFDRARIEANDPGWWSRHRLEIGKWTDYGRLLAEEDDETHAAVRAAYAEVERITHCVEHLGTWGPDGSRDFLEDDRLEEGHRPADTRAAITLALAELSKWREDVTRRLAALDY